MSRAQKDAVFASDAALLEWLTAPADQLIEFRVERDERAHAYRLVHPDSNRLLLVASKRRDSIKNLFVSANITISLPPVLTPEVLAYEEQLRAMGHTSVVHPKPVAKLRSDTSGARYSLFDLGRSPSKARGALDMRRELAAYVFSVVPGVYARRNTTAYLPRTRDAVRRPTSASDAQTLEARARTSDPDVVCLVGTIPNKPKALPLLPDYGTYAREISTKNAILHDPSDGPAPAPVLILGKLDRRTFALVVRTAFSPMQAFGLAVSSIDTSFTPQNS